MLGYLVAGWAIYFFVAREGARMAAAVAATSFLLGMSLDLALEARPYALMMGLTGVVLVCWQRAVRTRDRSGWTIGLAISMALLTLSHTFGFMFGAIPVLCAEVVRWRERRRLDRRILLAVGAGLLPMLVVLWFGMRTKMLYLYRFQGLRTKAAAPDLITLANTFILFLHSQSFELLMMALICVLLLRDRRIQVVSSFESFEWAAVWGVFVAALACWTVAALVTHYYFPRYGCATLVAITMLAGMGFSLGAGKSTKLLLGLTEVSLLILFAISAGHQVRTSMEPPAQTSGAAGLAAVPADGLPIVIASGLEYQEIARYAPAAILPRLIFVTDPSRVLRTSDFVPELVVEGYSDLGVLGLPVTTYSVFLKEHRSFYMFVTGLPSEWLPGALAQDGFQRAKTNALPPHVVLYQR
jgi:hypothetical protein